VAVDGQRVLPPLPWPSRPATVARSVPDASSVGGDEMPEVVETNGGQADLGAEAGEPTGSGLGTDWAGAVDLGGEHEAVEQGDAACHGPSNLLGAQIGDEQRS
jgi:hypothetical protein